MKQQPFYWMHSDDDALKVAVARYLSGAHLDSGMIVRLRDYLQQWIDSGDWHNVEDLRISCRLIRTRDDIDRWLAQANARAVDPL